MQKLGEQKKNFQTFNEVKDTDVRVWNRCSMAFNVGAKSVPLMKNYLSQFSPIERGEINAMFARIKDNGYENTKKEIMRTFSQNNHEEVDNLG